MNTDKQDTYKMTAEIEIEIPVEHWIDYLTQHNDIFLTTYSGYWARGAEHDPARGWLVFEDCDKGYEHGKEPRRREAVSAWQAGPMAMLPQGWHRLNREIAIKAYVEGVKMWGVGWFDDKGDANSYDAALQMAMLGELRYG